ncbi:anthranilate synthase component I family protein [Sphingobacterium sp. SGG-5]|uniref:anthranilate synthase component I family protein n=1 Tax=Sphingobacterium sp. SGG-5 TaxID=2710881 RepID=UPI0013EC2B28|nr:anthranilate synthase component I family protein [Sphingobacterium sp. SGG-5]NGM61589.1 anthranilate synthase component I family protein [Sphingobacterium sp. SGG-5]
MHKNAATALLEVERSVFEQRALTWAQQFEQVCFLHSNGYADEYGSIDTLLAVGAAAIFTHTGPHTFDKLNDFKARHPQRWMFGFFSYDLKNEIEELSTSFPNILEFPDAHFFVPQIVIRIAKETVNIHTSDTLDAHAVFAQIMRTDTTPSATVSPLQIQKRMSKADYMYAFEQLKNHIQRGDIYEVNLCQEFYAEDAVIEPVSTYLALNKISPTPFSTFFKHGDQYILSASPERFLAKRGETLISQPIKGTAPRGRSQAEDEAIREALRTNPKEVAENVMIVDLVRNDMTRSAKPGTVAAERKLEVKSYRQVHQLVSTITCTKSPEIGDIEALKNIFPPGSMTGAPKISAMALCDQYEHSRRGIYAGAVGYFAPDGDFDFNVVIRTILYNRAKAYLSFHTGGAITIDAQVEKEYEECLLKASAILKTLGTTLP